LAAAEHFVVLLAIWDCENHEFTTTTRVAELPYRGALAADDVGEGEQNRATPDLQGTTRRKARSGEIPRVSIKKTIKYQMDEQIGRIL